jgi:hypothetical protein
MENSGVNGLAAREPSLVRLYMDLTGASEATARSVFASLCCRETPDECAAVEISPAIMRRREPVTRNLLAREVEDPKWLMEAVAIPAHG